ncbi:rare lipoprotein A [cyanobacterium endosymbiont of Rhopalodia gibberula]|uniref:septal ring lytic transglycosylase RlpA family protein n=1 Tax=cyanobacterium endosymbiont of Rhopalodia gibberula TaxID=1763363 RepID=UPI000DC721CA|nr:septal ring lytic transglycosylase RlpA family protein [cyanobacterium endosymbiont of Rhopalodia gibberula]BBA79941.1 rare lipoprotein A [cyanobacterium endosymbiont of Rhopalodia gibberula]
MIKKPWKGIAAIVLATSLGTPLLLCGSLNSSVASYFRDKTNDQRELLRGETITTTESSDKSAIVTLHPHQWKSKLVVTLRVRTIPILTFIGTKAELIKIKNSENSSEQIPADTDVMNRAKAVAKRLNKVSHNKQFDSKNITVSTNAKNKSYTIKLSDKELVTIDGQTILSDTTNNLAVDALQATNRLRRLMGDALPLNAIANIPSAAPEMVIVGAKKQGISPRKGMASWYGPGFHGRLTANGERYNQNGLTAAHKNLPFGTRVRVTNLNNGRSITVRINDRGPYAHGRIIDLSKGAARVIGLMGSGVAPVQIEILGRLK